MTEFFECLMMTMVAIFHTLICVAYILIDNPHAQIINITADVTVLMKFELNHVQQLQFYSTIKH